MRGKGLNRKCKKCGGRDYHNSSGVWFLIKLFPKKFVLNPGHELSPARFLQPALSFPLALFFFKEKGHWEAQILPG